MQHHWVNLRHCCTWLFFSPASGGVPVHHGGPAFLMPCCCPPLALSSSFSSASPHDSFSAWWCQNRGTEFFDPTGRWGKALSSSSGAGSHMSITTMAQVVIETSRKQVIHRVLFHLVINTVVLTVFSRGRFLLKNEHQELQGELVSFRESWWKSCSTGGYRDFWGFIVRTQQSTYT